MSAKANDLSVTALYTSAAWSWGRLPNAELFDHVDARRVFGVVNTVLGIARPFIGLRTALPIALLHRHTLIDALLKASGAERVLELGAGLSRRGVTFTADPRISYFEIDRPEVIDRKRSLLERTAYGRAALRRPNFRLAGADVLVAPLDALCPPDDRPLFVIAEGLFMYLDADAQRKLARAVATRLGNAGGTLVFDFVPPRELPPPGAVGRGLDWAMRRWTGGQGFARDERSREQALADLLACGFDDVSAIEPRDVARAWGLPYPDAATQQLVFVARVNPRGRS
jgi:O-methyltransferase involved in polyketide biosynthesis